ncbi:L,D-transpeptidase catalytic domain-containing protein [Paenibacillus sp. 32O-W]|uniref:L,D-TPase catalytic domain-containing protein n=2 Tax=Paenibacillus TaxID=44249 RepID=A0ABQ4N7P8_9BACL|nr:MULTISPECIES: L,D-transpeptidase [Paenibacillus]ALS25739.1 L,D-transpeptidase catalytic domain-containing protein [Paenibacillus sp. 32O-W]GIQ64210.1 hypothetical protein PACILC2_27780 [Paenibacillus cisolokensis]
MKKILYMMVFLALMLQILISDYAAAGAPSSVQPAEQLEEESVYLMIDKSDNFLLVMMNGYAVYRFPVATGRNIHLTPTGQFRIVAKIVNPWYVRKQIPGGDPRNPLGTRWIGLNVPGTGGYTYGIHGTNRPYSIGSSASSGCVRMHNRDVEWLYRHIPLGTSVIIRN